MTNSHKPTDASRMATSKPLVSISASGQEFLFDHMGLVFFLSKLSYKPKDDQLPSYKELDASMKEDSSLRSFVSGLPGVRYRSRTLNVCLTKSELLDLFTGTLSHEDYAALFTEFRDAPELHQYDHYKKLAGYIQKQELQRFAERHYVQNRVNDLLARKEIVFGKPKRNMASQ